ncbi:MAG: pitrilysin family protein [Planctomycetota bacterium]
MIQHEGKPAMLAGATIHETQLSNGLTLLVAERHSDPVVAVMVWYGVGGRHEPAEVAGVSHFLEHMMFKGTELHGKGELDRITTVLGGSNNAFTTPDHTAYWFELASDRWERAFELESDRMKGLLLDPAEFAAEKQVVLEELSMGEDDPWRHLMRQVQSALFGWHPYSRPVIGYRETLLPMTPAQMRAHHSAHYRPGNAKLVVSGDVRPDEVLAAAERWFGAIPDREAAPSVPRPATASLEATVRLTTHWDDGASRLIMAWPGARVGSDDDYALDLVWAVLTGGKLGRMYRKLVVDAGVATSVSTNNDARAESGSFWLYAEAVRGVEPSAVEAAIDAQLTRLATELVDDVELDRAKRTLAAGEAFELETVTEVAENLGEFATDLDWRAALEVTPRRNAVTAEELRSVAQRVLVDGRRVVGWSLPKPGAADIGPADDDAGEEDDGEEGDGDDQHHGADV